MVPYNGPWKCPVANFCHSLLQNFVQVKVMDSNLRRHQLVFHHLPRPVLGERVGVREKPSPPLGLRTRNVDPADVLRVCEDTSLDGFMFGGSRHRGQFSNRSGAFN